LGEVEEEDEAGTEDEEEEGVGAFSTQPLALSTL